MRFKHLCVFLTSTFDSRQTSNETHLDAILALWSIGYTKQTSKIGQIFKIRRIS